MPGGSAAELVVDQDLSQHHAALLTGVAMVLNVVFGPAAGVVLVGRRRALSLAGPPLPGEGRRIRPRRLLRLGGQ